MKQKELLKQINPKYLNKKGRKKQAKIVGKKIVKKMTKYFNSADWVSSQPDVHVGCTCDVDDYVKALQRDHDDYLDKMINDAMLPYESGWLQY